MNAHQTIAARAADLIEASHWAAASLRSAFSYAASSPGRYPASVDGAFPDYEAAIAFERHWIGEREHSSDGTLISETATDRAERVGKAATVAALRAFASADANDRTRAATEAERAEMIRRADLARGFAGMSSGRTRERFEAKAWEWGAAAMALDDVLNGPLSADVASMDDDALLAALQGEG